MALIKTGKPKGETEQEKRSHARDLQGLLAQLDALDPSERRWAARDLAGHPDAVPELCGRLAVEDDETVREAVFTALITIANDAAVRGLIPLLRSEDARLRNGAIEALQQMNELIAPYIEDLLEDEDSDVRIFAVNVVESLRHPLSQDWLHAVIKRETHVNVLATAIDILAEIGAPDMIPDLEAAAERHPDEPFLRFAVKTAIRRIRGG